MLYTIVSVKMNGMTMVRVVYGDLLVAVARVVGAGDIVVGTVMVVLSVEAAGQLVEPTCVRVCWIVDAGGQLVEATWVTTD